MSTFDSQLFSNYYPRLLSHIMTLGYTEKNARTGQRLRFIPGGVSFTLRDCISDSLPLDGFRRLYPGTSAAEVAWFVSGSSDVGFLHDLKCHIWDKFTEPMSTHVAAAYGHRWRHHFGRDQLGMAIEALAADPSNRQVLVSAWDPAKDGLGTKALNVPCPAMYTLNVSQGSLHSTMLLRSSDVFVGLPYDVMGHAILVSCIAKTLGLRPGLLTFTLAHAHIYESHWSMAEVGLEGWMRRPPPRVGFLPLLPYSIADVEAVPMRFVDHYREASKMISWPNFNPKPEVIQ